MDKASVYKRKTISLIAKNLIIIVVLLAVTVLSIWAWFTGDTKSTADDVYAKAKADGVEISWDDENYYKDLVALDESQEVPGEIGVRYNLSGTVGKPASLKLISGNGLSFFDPVLNRRLGTVLKKNNTTEWEGVPITSANSEGKYIDIPLYFRSDSQRDIYLAGDSRVLPLDTTMRYSDYGPFSKDYICAASRVAFLNSSKNNCSFIWAPNADYELIDNDGYTKLVNYETDEITTTSGGSYNLDGFKCEKADTTYYFWTLTDQYALTKNPVDLSEFKAKPFIYDSKNKFYTVDIVTYIPYFNTNNPSIPFFINETSSAKLVDIDSYDEYVNGAKSNEEYDEYMTNGQKFNVTDTGFTIGNVTCSNSFKTNEFFTLGTKIEFTLAYNPETKRLVVLSYKSPNGNYSRGEEETEITTYIHYYSLEKGDVCALVNPSSSTAVSTDMHYKKAVSFEDADKLKIYPISITLFEQFITSEKTGDGATATYKFKNGKARTDQYLTITDGVVSFTSSGSSFTLEYIEGISNDTSGPAIKSGDYYLVFKDGVLSAVTKSELDSNDLITVYIGTSYAMDTDEEIEDQTYQYYNQTYKTLINLDSYSNPKLFTNTNRTSELVRVGNTKIVTLTKTDETDPYYTAKIYMRVWVEGTDRDAQTPLADGMFSLHLHFTSQ